MSGREEQTRDDQATNDEAAPDQVGDAASPTAAADTRRGTAPFPVVGIGASAGGLAAFEAFLSAMAPDELTGMAYVLVQHLSPDHASVLVDLIRRYTKMPVHEAQDGMLIRPDCVYVIPPNHDLDLVGGALLLTHHGEVRRPRLTIDHFFQSLAHAQRDRAICIVLSGTGSDGTLGLRKVKAEGGLALAQAPESAEYDDMPRSAIATGLVDYVLPPAQMPAQLLGYVRHAFDPQRQPSRPLVEDTLLQRICAHLRVETGHDFSQYKETTLLRRIERRMALHQDTQAEMYLRRLREDREELEALCQDLMIGVTEFFRDPEAFRQLRELALPKLLANRAMHDVLRVWVCGCSTGEEAYSLTILLYEHILELKRPLKLQVFATDIDRRAIEQARAGIYSLSIASTVSEERLDRFFTHDPQRGTYRVQKSIRDLLVFSEQDVIRDPPFSRIDLVSCRNLLIYLNTDLQQKLIELFHYALVPDGILLLGSSETVGEGSRLFLPLDRKWKIYRRVGDRFHVPNLASRSTIELEPGLYRHARRTRADDGTLEGGRPDLRRLTERALISHYAQAGILIDARARILHIVGRTGKFLEPADGDADMNILAMAREGLRRELTVALHKAVAQREPVAYSGMKVRLNGGFIRASAVVRPVEGTNDLYLVVLEELPERPQADAVESVEAQSDRITELERELRAKDEYLQTTLEEMETTNEELKSTNEEMQSINEELQSTNEELETSKEELQSVNEELSTVNAELQDRVADLFRANNDMNNLLAGTGVGTIFVDHQLRIARFTPAATQTVNLIATDIGRPLAHVATNFAGYDRLVDDIRHVLESLAPFEAEVRVRGGAPGTCCGSARIARSRTRSKERSLRWSTSVRASRPRIRCVAAKRGCAA